MINIIPKYIFRLIGFFVFLYILTLVDFARFREVLGNVNMFLFTLSVFLTLALILIKGKRWQYINRVQSIDISIFKIFMMFTLAIALGQVTPGRLGELIKVRLIKKYSPDLAKRWSGVLIDRIHDIIVLFFAGLVAVFFVTQIEFNYSYIIIFLLIIGILLFLLINKYGKVCLYWFTGRILNQGKYLSVKENIKDVFDKFSKTFKDSFIKSFCYSLLSYLVQCISTLMIVYSVGAKVPIYTIVLVVSVTAFVSLLPITIGGFGTREGVYIYLFSQYGISLETSLAIAFIDGILIFTFFIGMLAFIFWVTNRFSIEF
ncbi:MAG: flippase-like domain-containing protein [Candidatus Cloacimonetes bacterium]|nr:flippase-like domain-containing protein [Candidatus Cloacimonadota bacterium]